MAEPVRLPLAQSIATRDSTMRADAIMYNCFPAKQNDQRLLATRRFGVQYSSQVTAGAALGFFAFGANLLAIVGTTLYSNGTNVGTVDGTSPYQFTPTGQGGTAVFLKNNSAAYTWDGTTLAHVTDANYPAATVPGVGYLDGYVFVIDTAGRVWNSNLNTPATWNALNYISGSVALSPGAGLARLYNYVIAFTTLSTGFFADAGNTPPGSPLLPNLPATVNIGCASGTTIVATENTVYWVGQTRQKGRAVYMMNGLNPQAVSDEHIDRILNADNLAGASAFFIKTNGHAFYVLTLPSSNCTLVYDSMTGAWARWSTTAAGAALASTNAYVSNRSVFVVLPNHGLANGTVVNVTSSNSAPAYLGTVVPTIIDANTISYPVSVSLNGGVNSGAVNSQPVNGGTVTTNTNTGLGALTVTPYVQNYFQQTYYAYASNTDYLLGATDGKVYLMQEGVSSDNGAFIYTLMRTGAGDFGSNKVKFFSRAEVIADKAGDVAYLGYSDDDFVTFAPFRTINLGANRSLLRRLGAARRRAFSLLYIGGFPMRFYELELDVMEGTQ